MNRFTVRVTAAEREREGGRRERASMQQAALGQQALEGRMDGWMDGSYYTRGE